MNYFGDFRASCPRIVLYTNRIRLMFKFVRFPSKKSMPILLLVNQISSVSAGAILNPVKWVIQDIICDGLKEFSWQFPPIRAKLSCVLNCICESVYKVLLILSGGLPTDSSMISADGIALYFDGVFYPAPIFPADKEVLQFWILLIVFLKLIG